LGKAIFLSSASALLLAFGPQAAFGYGGRSAATEDTGAGKAGGETLPAALVDVAVLSASALQPILRAVSGRWDQDSSQPPH